MVSAVLLDKKRVQ